MEEMVSVAVLENQEDQILAIAAINQDRNPFYAEMRYYSENGENPSTPGLLFEEYTGFTFVQEKTVIMKAESISVRRQLYNWWERNVSRNAKIMTNATREQWEKIIQEYPLLKSNKEVMTGITSDQDGWEKESLPLPLIAHSIYNHPRSPLFITLGILNNIK